MASNVQTIIDAALGTSFKNRPSTVANNSAELVAAVDRRYKMTYAAAAKANPGFFMNVASIPFASGGWVKPSDCQLLVRLEAGSGVQTAGLAAIAAGTEIIIVPYDDRLAETLLPAVYFVAGQYKSAGNTLDPASGNLTFYYSRRPTTLAAVTDAFDALWDETYNAILINDLAAYLCRKDGRGDEGDFYSGESDNWLQLFLDYVSTEAVNEVRRGGIPRTAIWKGIKTTQGPVA